MSPDSYSNEEFAGLGPHEKPSKGVFCPRCRNFIPSFSDLGPKGDDALRKLGPHAYTELRKRTGCSAFFAKLWMIHPHGPHEEKKHLPCPYCGAGLPTEKSQQCLSCGWDWHDFERPIRHVVKKTPNQAAQTTPGLRPSVSDL